MAFLKIPELGKLLKYRKESDYMIVKELLEEYPNYETEYYYVNPYILRTRGLFDIHRIRLDSGNLTEVYENVNPYSLIEGDAECGEGYELMNKEDYSYFTGIEKEYIDNDVLVIILAEEDGIMPDRTVWEDVEKGHISDELLSEVCHTYSKLAKEYRHNGALLNSNYVPDARLGKEREDKKNDLYEKKDIILSRYNPKGIHYDTAFSTVYLFYEFGNHTFHHSICRSNSIEDVYNDLEKCGINSKGLEIEEMSAFESAKENVDSLLNERFCDFVLEKINPLVH
jgi:hypothetical protein